MFHLCRSHFYPHVTTLKLFSLTDNAVAAGDTLQIVSPNYPQNYPNEQDITWVIRSLENAILRIMFVAFYLQNRYDFVFIGNGNDPSVGQLKMFSGNYIPDDLFSPSVWIRFTSNDYSPRSGFSILISGVEVESE